MDERFPPGDQATAIRSSFRLVEKNVSSDTVTFLKHLLAEAEKGDLIGVAAVLMYQQRDFSGDATGECRRSPFFVIGALRALEDKLLKLGGSR